MKIEVPDSVLHKIAKTARRRNAENRTAKQTDGLVSGHNKTSLRADFEGAIGEWAVAKALDLEWDGEFFEHGDWEVWRTEGHDVEGLEVRTTMYRFGRLIVQPSNKDDVPYVLVTLAEDYREAHLRGWSWGRDVKQPKHWQEFWARPTYAMAQSDLQPIEDLIARL